MRATQTGRGRGAVRVTVIELSWVDSGAGAGVRSSGGGGVSGGRRAGGVSGCRRADHDSRRRDAAAVNDRRGGNSPPTRRLECNQVAVIVQTSSERRVCPRGAATKRSHARLGPRAT